MKTGKIFRKLISFNIIIAIILCIFAVIPVSVHAASTWANADYINDYFDHGGTGTLLATVSPDTKTLTITGEVTGAKKTLKLQIDPNLTVIWKANYSGNFNSELIEVSGTGTFEVADGGVIKNDGGICIWIKDDGATLSVCGGSVIAAYYYTAIVSWGSVTINVSSGIVTNSKGYAILLLPPQGTGTINITGGTVSSSDTTAICLIKSKLNVSGGFIYSPSSQVLGYSGVIYAYNGATTTYHTNAVICGWNKASGTTVYTEGSKDNLSYNFNLPYDHSATVEWAKKGTQNGIYYKNGTTEGFYPIDDVTVNPVTYSLTVNSGTGSGNYMVGETVEIKANAAPSGQAFDRWTVSGVDLADTSSAETSFVMPSNAVVATAEYKELPESLPPEEPDANEQEKPVLPSIKEKTHEAFEPYEIITEEPPEQQTEEILILEATSSDTVDEAKDGISLLWVLFIGLAVVVLGGIIAVIMIVNADKKKLTLPQTELCGSCGSQVQIGAKFCSECGFQMVNNPSQQYLDNEDDKL